MLVVACLLTIYTAIVFLLGMWADSSTSQLADDLSKVVVIGALVAIVILIVRGVFQ